MNDAELDNFELSGRSHCAAGAPTGDILLNPASGGATVGVATPAL